jgi:hypothetical protein
VDESDNKTGLTGLSPTVMLSKNGGAFASPLGAVSEVGYGLYKVAANVTDASTLGPLLLHAEATGANDQDELFWVQTNPPGGPLVSVIADANWDELLSGHAISGSAGDTMSDFLKRLLALAGSKR